MPFKEKKIRLEYLDYVVTIDYHGFNISNFVYRSFGEHLRSLLIKALLDLVTQPAIETQIITFNANYGTIDSNIIIIFDPIDTDRWIVTIYNKINVPERIVPEVIYKGDATVVDITNVLYIIADSDTNIDKAIQDRRSR